MIVKVVTGKRKSPQVRQPEGFDILVSREPLKVASVPVNNSNDYHSSEDGSGGHQIIGDQRHSYRAPLAIAGGILVPRLGRSMPV